MAGAVAWAAGGGGGGGGVTVNINGVGIVGDSPRVPGCALKVSVGGVGTGTHQVEVAVAAREPSGSASLVDVAQSTSTGSLTVGPYDVSGLVVSTGLVAKDNGYHLQATIDLDGTQAFSKPFWLACGHAQHAGQSVRMTFAVTWKDKNGRTSTTPAAGLPSDFLLSATSTHGTATCSYTGDGSGLVCNYPASEGENAQPSLQVPGLGDYTVVEQGLPAGWAPDPTTVGVFAANASLPGAGTNTGDELRPMAAATATHEVVNVEQPNGPGYRLTAADGGVFSLGSAGFYGSMSGTPLAAPIVGTVNSPTGEGYWLVAADGGVFAFGDAGFYGSMGNQALNQPIVGMASTSTGHGYWLVAADGGIFAFGDAAFFGSMGNQALNQPIVGMAGTSTGDGYWLVASDGGIFAFGDATFYGSIGSMTLDQPIVGMAATPDGHGYWLAGAGGDVVSLGDAGSFGSLRLGLLEKPVVGIGPS